MKPTTQFTLFLTIAIMTACTGFVLWSLLTGNWGQSSANAAAISFKSKILIDITPAAMVKLSAAIAKPNALLPESQAQKDVNYLVQMRGWAEVHANARNNLQLLFGYANKDPALIEQIEWNQKVNVHLTALSNVAVQIRHIHPSRRYTSAHLHFIKFADYLDRAIVNIRKGIEDNDVAKIVIASENLRDGNMALEVGIQELTDATLINAN